MLQLRKNVSRWYTHTKRETQTESKIAGLGTNTHAHTHTWSPRDLKLLRRLDACRIPRSPSMSTVDMVSLPPARFVTHSSSSLRFLRFNARLA